MKNIMSMTESLDQVMQLEVAVPLTVGICMLMYTCFFLFTYKEKSSGGKASAKKAVAKPSKATRCSVRETKAPKVWGEEDEPKSPTRASRRAAVKSPTKTPKKTPAKSKSKSPSRARSPTRKAATSAKKKTPAKSKTPSRAKSPAKRVKSPARRVKSPAKRVKSPAKTPKKSTRAVSPPKTRSRTPYGKKR